MPDQPTSRTVYEETLDNVTVRVHCVDEEYYIVLASDEMAYFSPPFASLEDCEVEIRAMRRIAEEAEYRVEAA